MTVYGRLLNGIGILLDTTSGTITGAKETNILYLHNVKNYAPSRHSLHMIILCPDIVIVCGLVYILFGVKDHITNHKKQVTKGIYSFIYHKDITTT